MVQLGAVSTTLVVSGIGSFIILKVIDMVIGLRVTEEAGARRSRCESARRAGGVSRLATAERTQRSSSGRPFRSGQETVRFFFAPRLGERGTLNFRSRCASKSSATTARLAGGDFSGGPGAPRFFPGKTLYFSIAYALNRPPLPKRLGEILVERGKLDPANLERALKLQEGESREKIGVILLRLGMVSGRDLADALADQLDLPLALAADFPELPLMEERLSAKFLRDAQAVPLREDDEELALAVADPTDSFVLSAVQMASGKRVRAYIAAPNEIDAALERLYGGGQARPWARSSTTSSARDEERGLRRRRAPEGPRLAKRRSSGW